MARIAQLLEAQAAVAPLSLEPLSSQMQAISNSLDSWRESVIEAEQRPIPIQPDPGVRELIQTVDRVVRKLEDLLSKPDPPAPVLQPIVELPEIERRLGKITQQLAALVKPESKPRGPDGELPIYRALGPPTINPSPINLTMTNTIAMPENVITELVPLEADIFNLSIFNAGPAELWLRLDDHAGIADPLSVRLPASMSLNDWHIPRTVWVIADEDGSTLSITLKHV
jgi:hypothetical protein